MNPVLKAVLRFFALLICGYWLVYWAFVTVSVLPYKWMDFNGNGWVSMHEAWRSTDVVAVRENVADKRCRKYVFAKELETITVDCGAS